MSRRVVLGKLGTDGGVGQYGLRIARATYDAANADPSTATVGTAGLVFDSINPQEDLPLYKIYDVTVSGASTSGCTYSEYHIPGSYTQSFGETLSAPPIPLVYEKGASTLKSDYYYNSLVCPQHDLSLFINVHVPTGGYAEANLTHLKVYNLNTSQTTYRVFLLRGVA